MEINYKCTKCGQFIKANRSTAMDRGILWQDLLRIAEEHFKPHIEAEHPDITFVRIEPWPTDGITKEECALVYEIYDKTGTHLWYNLPVGYDKEKRKIYFLD